MNFQSKNCLSQQKLSLGSNHRHGSHCSVWLDHLLLSSWQGVESLHFTGPHLPARADFDTFDVCHFPTENLELHYNPAGSSQIQPVHIIGNVIFRYFFFATGILPAVAGYCAHFTMNPLHNIQNHSVKVVVGMIRHELAKVLLKNASLVTSKNKWFSRSQPLLSVSKPTHQTPHSVNMSTLFPTCA